MNLRSPKQILGTAVRSLMQQKLRALLSVLGVVCGVMAVVAMIAVGQGAKREVIRQIEQLGTFNIYVKAVALSSSQLASAREHRSSGLSVADMQRIVRGVPSMAGIGCLREVRVAMVGTPREMSPEVVACSASYADLLRIPLASGRFISNVDDRQKNLVCVLGHDLARRLGNGDGSLDVLRMGDHLLKVVGILHRAPPATGESSAIARRNYNAMVFIPLSIADSLIAPDRSTPPTTPMDNALSEIVVQVSPGEDVIATSRLVGRILSVAHHGVQDYQLIVPLELLDQSRQTQRTFNAVLGSIAGISLLVGGIGIMNIMLATVSERIREIGIRRSVGATRRDIMRQFIVEAVVLTVVGGMIGLLGGMAAVAVIARLAGWPVAISGWGIAVPLGMSLLVGVFFGLYPARRAADVDPIVALRHE